MPQILVIGLAILILLAVYVIGRLWLAAAYVDMSDAISAINDHSGLGSYSDDVEKAA